MSQANLSLFETNSDSFLERFLTQDECLVHHFEAETKRQSMQWKHSSSPPPKMAKVVSSAGKVMASVFWDAKAFLLKVSGTTFQSLKKHISISKSENKVCR